MTMNDQDNFFFTRRDFLVAGSGLVLSAALPVGCGGDDDSARPVPDDPSAVGTPWAGTSKALDLIEHVHMADVYHHGEFVDFGTAARFKYSLGGWMSGWGNDTLMNGVAFTWATKSPSRLYFSLDEAKPLTFEFRVKKGGIDVFSAYLNDKPLQRAAIKGNDWEIHRIEATEEQAKAGENYFKLIYKESDRIVDGIHAAFAVDYLRIIPQGTNTPKEFTPPHVDNLKQRFKVKDRERDALMLSSNTTLVYYAQIPANASLCLAGAFVPEPGQEKVKEIKLKVRVTNADGGPPGDLFDGVYGISDWKEDMVDLGAVAGKLARIELIVSGPAKARLALGDPSIRIKPPKVEIPDKKVKNVIVLLIDTLRADKLTAYAKTRVKSTVFEKFAGESALFERCQANSNWTKPSCASVLTGLYPDSHKARGHSSRLASSVKMASEIFFAAGFSTGAFIANGYLAKEFGFKRGWTKYVNYIRETKNTDAQNVFKESLEFIKEHSDKPFFTYIQTIDPHVPYDPPDEFLKVYDAQSYDGPVRPRSTGNILDQFKRKKIELNARDKQRLEALYDGEINYHDVHFGHFLDGLKTLGVLDDTIIIVCSDHGEEFFDHDSVGHGHTLHQELLHVPLVMRAPGLVPRGKRIPHDVGLADILPTALAATGQAVPKGMEGANLIPAANGTFEDPLGAAFSSFWSEADSRNLQWSVRKGNWKMRMRGPVNTYVHNLAQDPREKMDVDERYPIALRALRIALGQFIAAPDKAAWTSGQIASQIVIKPEADEDKIEALPEDLKAQLRQLGYMQ